MAVLDSTNRTDLWAEFMRDNKLTLSISKSELRAAIDAADDWLEANSTAYNTALPQPARGALTAKQKAAILSFVAGRRANII